MRHNSGVKSGSCEARPLFGAFRDFREGLQMERQLLTTFTGLTFPCDGGGVRGVTCKGTQRPVSGGGRLSPPRDPRGAHRPAPDQPRLAESPRAREVTLSSQPPRSCPRSLRL